MRGAMVVVAMAAACSGNGEALTPDARLADALADAPIIIDAPPDAPPDAAPDAPPDAFPTTCPELASAWRARAGMLGRACESVDDCALIGDPRFQTCNGSKQIAETCNGVAVSKAALAPVMAELDALEAEWFRLCEQLPCGSPGVSCWFDCGPPGVTCVNHTCQTIPRFCPLGSPDAGT